MTAPRSGLPNPLASRAVLVGVSDYRTLEQLPAVANNVTTLRQVITDAELWGLPDDHCVTLLNPTSIDEVLDAVHTAASMASDALLFYFAGHGLLDDRSELYLALSDSDSDRLYRAVRYDDIRREVVGTARACYGKVVLLDCCYSGRALQGGMSGSVDLADHARVDGTYLMTASAETSLALAPPGENYTAFTGVLVDKLLHGLPDGPDLLDMETLFYNIRADLQAKHFPVPQQRSRNDGQAIALVRNRRGAGHGPGTSGDVDAPVRELPRPPVGHEALLRRRPADVYAEVQRLRMNDQAEIAHQILISSAAMRPDQEVAAIVDLIRRQGAGGDLQTVLVAAAGRPPNELLRLVDALHDTDLPDEAMRFVRAVGSGSVADVASLAHLFEGGGRADELAELLDAALDTAQERSSLIGLVNALWVAGLREDVDSLINRAVSKLPGTAVVTLADELRAVGREEAAFGLYAASAEALTARSPDVIAQLCQAMTEAGRTDDSGRIAQAMINNAASVPSLLDIASAFWDTGQENHADQTLARAAEILPNDDVTLLAGELRNRGHDEAAFQLYLRALLRRRADSIQEILTALREEGRPVDARKLLEAVAGQAPMDTLSDLLGSGTDADRHRLLVKAVNRDPGDVAKLLDALVSRHPTIARQITDLIATNATSRAELLPIIIDRVDPASKGQLLTSAIASGVQQVVTLLTRLPAEDARNLMFLAVKTGNPVLASVIEQLQLAFEGSGNAVFRYLADQPLDRFAPLLDGLRRAGFDEYADMLLAVRANQQRGVRDIADEVVFLFDTQEPQAGVELVGKALTGRSNDELVHLIAALRRRDHPEALAAAAAQLKQTYARFGLSNVNGILRTVGLHEFADGRSWGWRRK